MAVESKPLFHPEVIRQHVRSFTLPESVEGARPLLQRWADLIDSGRADSFKETALLPEFISDIFFELLGYTGPSGPPTPSLCLAKLSSLWTGKRLMPFLGGSIRRKKSSSSRSKAKAPGIRLNVPSVADACRRSINISIGRWTATWGCEP
jgi:hypothetical protein